MARSTIRINHSEIQSYLDGNHGVRELLYSKAEPVAQALRDDPHDDTGAFEDGVTIEEHHTDRLVLRVGSTDFKGAILEANYGLHSRALDAAG
jgi:hypothetical protein